MADSPQLVSAYFRSLTFWARMRVCEKIYRELNMKNTRMLEYENASLREYNNTKKTRTLFTRTEVCKNTSPEHEKDEYASLREREHVNPGRKREFKHESARYTASWKR